MRTIQTIFGVIGLFGLMTVQTGCEQEELQAIVAPSGESGIHTVAMSFIGQLHNYEDAITKAGVQWQNGDKLYITFTVGSTTTPGTAVYQDGKWTMTYEGELSAGENIACTVRYFTNVQSETIGLIGLGSDSGVYEDLNGQYTYGNGILSVNAGLRPKLGRIRLKGTPDTKCMLNGIETFGGFSPQSGTFTTGPKILTLTVGEDGYTPYIYGNFDNDSKAIGFLGKQDAYTRYFAGETLVPGKSGYMAIPTPEAHNNWRTGLYLSVGNVTFRMIGVPGYSGGYYLMAETELTNAQYYKVKDITNSKLPNYPHQLSYSDCLDYISRLNAATGFTFSLPTYNQWVWAAKGGSASLGRTFAGSDVAIDVAWYNLNAASGAKEVKQKSPNELGLYDMSGNYNEWTSTLENESWAGSYRRAGGCYSDGLEGIKVNSYTYYEGWSTTFFPEGAGMRLCLNINLE